MIVLPLPSGAVAGRLSYVQQSSSLAQEVEPNDDVNNAQRLPDGYPGQASVIYGELNVAGGDTLDAYRIRFPERSVVTLRLAYDQPNDFALAYYDPLSMQFVRTVSGTEPAIAMLVHGVIDVVVIGTSGTGQYNVTMTVDVPPAEIAENDADGLANNDTPAGARILGEIRHGKSLRVIGETQPGTDVIDAMLMACPQDADIACNLAIAAFSDMVLRVSDVTSGLGSPNVLATFGGPISQPRIGTVGVSAGTLLLLEVEIQSAGGTWQLDVSSTPPGSSKLIGTPQQFVRAGEPRIALLDAEADTIRSGTPYGRIAGELMPGEVIVCFCHDQAEQGASTADSAGCELLEDAPSFCLMSFDTPLGQNVDQQARHTFARCCTLSGGAGIAYAEPNAIRRPLKEPNDTYYDLQSWHYEMLNLPNAWEITTGSPNTIVAVIDTGRLNHLDLDSRQIGGYDFVTGQYAGDGDGVDANPDDHGVQTSYHGGHCAGTIGAASDNGAGVAGVTWATRIMPIRALGDYGVGSDFDIANAILYAARQANNSGTLPGAAADVISMSLGGPSFSQAINNACNTAKQQGIVIFAAAGNDNSTTPSYPAGYSSVISIVALDAYRNRAPYSNYGPSVTLSAPGGDVSADADADGYADGVLSTSRDANGPNYRFLQGTSMACPHAAGVAALLLGEDPTLTPFQVETILKDTALDLGASGRDDNFGWGLIDAYAALLAVAPPVPPTDPVLQITPSTVNLGAAQITAKVFLRNGQPTSTNSLVVNDATVVTDDGGTWLTATLVGPSSASQNFAGLDFAASRTGLGPGAYRAVVTVTSNGGDRSVVVLMQVVATTLPRPNIDIIVRAVSAETGEVVQERTVNPATSLVYEFAALPIGEYVFTAGTDIDGDGELCEAGDFCGQYPSRGETRSIRITRNTVVSNINFDVIRELTLGTLSR